MNKKIIHQILAGLTGALAIGILLGYIILIYGANNGCFSFGGGYETCGTLGFLIGSVIGMFLGLVLYKKFK
ncbi:hypothetical protein HYT56_02515 [Candidatus Woesearchaeota archaeon]|nr:hypothetical protein [Candidatus Woesearchaeota archaeon]